MNRYILASQSPRRRQLLHMVLRDYEVIPARGEEKVTSTDPAEVVVELSRQKALEVAGGLSPLPGDRMIVIGADTVVAVDGQILGKPADREDAARMIRLIQGRSHHVYTGVTICWLSGGEDDASSCSDCKNQKGIHSFYEETEVEVYPMDKGEIEGYISLQEPYDKAGAYGIQGAFGVFIKGIRGDYNNVVGLPGARIYHEMAALDLL